MNEHSEIELRRALRDWEARQRMDGYVAAAAVFLSLFSLLQFLVTPERAGAWAMGLFLLVLAVAACRLLRSAAKVVALRSTLCPRIVPEVIEAEVIDPDERSRF
jgi:hypothetical protein